VQEVYQLVLDLTPRQRRALTRSLDRLTTTNCSWIIYQARPLLRGFIAMATPLRRRRKTSEES